MKVDNLLVLVQNRVPYIGRERSDRFSPIQLVHTPAGIKVEVTAVDREKHLIYIPSMELWRNINDYELPEPEELNLKGGVMKSMGQQIMDRASHVLQHPTRKEGKTFDPLQVRIKGDKQMRFIDAIDMLDHENEKVQMSNGQWIYTRRIELPDQNETSHEPPPAA